MEFPEDKERHQKLAAKVEQNNELQDKLKQREIIDEKIIEIDKELSANETYDSEHNHNHTQIQRKNKLREEYELLRRKWERLNSEIMQINESLRKYLEQ